MVMGKVKAIVLALVFGCPVFFAKNWFDGLFTGWVFETYSACKFVLPKSYNVMLFFAGILANIVSSVLLLPVGFFFKKERLRIGLFIGVLLVFFSFLVYPKEVIKTKNVAMLFMLEGLLFMPIAVAFTWMGGCVRKSGVVSGQTDKRKNAGGGRALK